jgi:transcriptional regulator with XRE-family HTH domain
MRTNNIAALRKKVKMTQKELADHLGAAQTTVSGWERGAYEPDISQLDKMASIFDVTIGYLMGYEETNYKPATKKEITSGEFLHAWEERRFFEKEFYSEQDEYEAEREEERMYVVDVLRQNWLNSKLPIHFESYYINEALDNMTKNERARLLSIAQIAFPNAFTMIFEGE